MQKNFGGLGAILPTDTPTHNNCTKLSDEKTDFIYNDLYLKK